MEDAKPHSHSRCHCGGGCPSYYRSKSYYENNIDKKANTKYSESDIIAKRK
jgi:hypothetical protein